MSLASFGTEPAWRSASHALPWGRETEHRIQARAIRARFGGLGQAPAADAGTPWGVWILLGVATLVAVPHFRRGLR